MANNPRARYTAAGVDVSRGDAFVERIAGAAASTARAGAAPALGGFAGVFDLAAAGHEGSLLVASTDGVGTKVRLAKELGRHHGIGIDLVAMCVNDILAQGAEPLLFLDYYASGRLEPEAAAAFVEGVAEGCREAGCALLGGETAEMPGHYAAGDYDVAGFVVGAVPRTRLLPQGVAAGDVIVALPSSGVHANGFSLVRRLLADTALSLADPFGDGTLGEALLTPTRIYVRPVLSALGAGAPITAIAHITGGGLLGNVPRVLPTHLAAEIDAGALPRQPLLDYLQGAGDLSHEEMRATFNAGVGLVLTVPGDAADALCRTLAGQGERPSMIGTVRERANGTGQCLIS